MTAPAFNRPMPGELLDPPPREVPGLVRRAGGSNDARAEAIGVVYKAFDRFRVAKSLLLAAGTTYYSFLALFSLVAVAYGVTAILGAERVAALLTEALADAFPGLLGEQGIDPGVLSATGQAASIVGLIVMLYSGSGMIVAMSSSIHLIYGAPPDPRNFLAKRFVLLGWLVIVGPLTTYSFVAGSINYAVSSRILDAIGIDTPSVRLLIDLGGIALALAADDQAAYILLGRLGGIRPPIGALLLGSATAALAIQLLRIPMGLILNLSIDRPQYGSLAIPVGILLVLYLNAVVIYAAAALTAGIAERDVPLEPPTPTIGLEEVNSSDGD